MSRGVWLAKQEARKAKTETRDVRLACIRVQVGSYNEQGCLAGLLDKK